MSNIFGQLAQQSLGLPMSLLGGIGGLFGGGSPKPFKQQGSVFNVNGAKGGTKFLGGTFDPATGTFTMRNPGNRDFSQQQAAIDAYLAGTGPRPEGKQFSRLLQAIDASGYKPGMGPAGQGAPMAPFMQMFQQQVMPQMMMNPAMFARPEARALLQGMFPQPPQNTGIVPPQYTGPGSGMGNPFASFMQQQGTPGPAPNPLDAIAKYGSAYGNGGGAPLPGYIKGQLPNQTMPGVY